MLPFYLQQTVLAKEDPFQYGLLKTEDCATAKEFVNAEQFDKVKAVKQEEAFDLQVP